MAKLRTRAPTRAQVARIQPDVGELRWATTLDGSDMTPLRAGELHRGPERGVDGSLLDHGIK